VSLYAELRRRNVFRVAAAYVVIGWLILQVAEILLGFTGAPEWVGKAIIALLLLGFVPVLALAWVFEVGPEGVRRDDGTSSRDAGPQARRLDVLTLAGVVFVVILLVWQHLGPALTGGQAPGGGPQTESPLPAASEARPRAEPPQFEAPPGSVAVLPFTNRSAEPDTGYFVDGIHDDLLTELSRNGALTVISRTSMMEYRDTTKNLRQIGSELGVAHVLEGAVQRAGQRVRINAQLIDARTDAHLWADTFDRELTPEGIFDIQSEIASAIARALGKALGLEAQAPAAAATPTTNARAYDLYLRARALSGRRSEPEIRQAIELHRQALGEDPEFALAMGELGLELTNLYWFFTRRNAESGEARQWIDRALALQPEQPRLRWILARHLYHGELDYDGALDQLALAEQGMPGSAEVFVLRSWILRRAGRIDDSLQAMTTAATLDPRSADVLLSLVETHGGLGDIESAESWYRRLAHIPGIQTGALLTYPMVRRDVLGDLDAFARAAGEYPQAPGAVVAMDLLLLPYLQRDFERAKQGIAAYPLELLEEQFYLLPKALLNALVAQAAGEVEATARFAGEALVALDAILAEHPGDYRAMSSKAQALALLGRADPARAWAQKAVDSPLPQRDVLLRAEMQADRLQALALVDDSDTLAGELDDYLQLPYKIDHFDGLMLDPLFDRHRDHPAFRALAAKYSRKAGET
jgi:TolB-like protein